MSQHRKNQMQDKVIGKEWIHLERHTLPRESVGHCRRRGALKCGMASFYGLGNFIG